MNPYKENLGSDYKSYISRTKQTLSTTFSVIYLDEIGTFGIFLSTKSRELIWVLNKDYHVV